VRGHRAACGAHASGMHSGHGAAPAGTLRCGRAGTPAGVRCCASSCNAFAAGAPRRALVPAVSSPLAPGGGTLHSCMQHSQLTTCNSNDQMRSCTERCRRRNAPLAQLTPAAAHQAANSSQLLCSKTEDGFECTWAANVVAPFLLSHLLLSLATTLRPCNQPTGQRVPTDCCCPVCSKTEDGFERTWAVNVIAPFLLTHLLLPIVSERVVNVSSISASSKLDFGDLNAEKGFSANKAYGASKLAMQMFTAELARRAPAVTTLSLDPGTVNTKMLYAGWGPCGMDVRFQLC
jgi:short chain dehydrogenase